MASNGTGAGMLPEQIAHSRFIILWGTNTVVTNLHLWHFIREAWHTARVWWSSTPENPHRDGSDLHIQPMPGTDAALALGMMHVIVKEGRHDAEYVRSHTVGFEALCARLADYAPERVAQLTGIDAVQIAALARDYATVKPACIRTLVGMEHHAFGAMTFRTIGCLSALTGAWKDLGGGHLHMTGALHSRRSTFRRAHAPARGCFDSFRQYGATGAGPDRSGHGSAHQCADRVQQ
jgi:anaerobic selenocysteine-containing dehydrogenase